MNNVVFFEKPWSRLSKVVSVLAYRTKDLSLSYEAIIFNKKIYKKYFLRRLSFNKISGFSFLSLLCYANDLGWWQKATSLFQIDKNIG